MPQLGGQLPGRGARALSRGEGEGTLVSALWGHNPLSAPFLSDKLPGPTCYCGRTGCVETWLSVPCFTADARRHGVKASNTAEVITVFRRGRARALPPALGALARGGGQHPRTLETSVGELWISAMDSDVEPWLAYMFRDVERAKFHVAGPLNHYSGKWNHMHSDLLLIKQQLDKVMQIAPSTPCVAPSGHFKRLQDSGVASNPEERS